MSAKEPVTIYISRRIKPGAEAAVAQWQKDVRVACEQFEGFIGSRVLEPHSQDGENIYSVVVRFDSFQSLRRWEESEVRNRLYNALKPHILSEDISRLSGFEPWFPAPGGPAPPPRWKMCLMAFMAVYPIVLIIRLTIGPFLGDFPLPLAVFLMSIPTSLLMSYLAMPGLTRLFRRWLYPER